MPRRWIAARLLVALMRLENQRQCRSGADDAGAVIPDTIRRGAARFAGIARHQLACQPVFIAGFSGHLNQLVMPILSMPCPIYARRWPGYHLTRTRDAGASGAWALPARTLLPFQRCKCRCIVHRKPFAHIINNSNSRHWHRAANTGEFFHV